MAVNRALYHNIDVTHQVNQLAQQGGGVIAFARDFNSCFGDPAPGVPKTLQITFTPAGGAQQTQNFAEGQWNQVRIALWGVSQATYHNRDVSHQVRQIAQQNGGWIRFGQDFNSLFGDPAPGIPKTLQIHVNGGVHNFAEGQWNQVNIQVAAPVAAGGQIVRATYHNVDVTAQVRNFAQQHGNVIRFDRDFNSCFGDPAFGVAKSLTIQYQLPGGGVQQQAFAEGQWNQVNINLNGGGFAAQPVFGAPQPVFGQPAGGFGRPGY